MKHYASFLIIFFCIVGDVFAFGPYVSSSYNYILKEQKSNEYYVHFKNDPVNLRNGNLYLGYEDIFIPGRLPLQIFRAYNSRNSVIGPFGKGWTYNLGMYIRETRYETIQIIEADGFINEFSRDGNPYATKKRFAELLTKEREEEDKAYQGVRRRDYYDDFLNRLMNDPDFYATIKRRYQSLHNYPKPGTYYSKTRGKKIVVKHERGYTFISNDDLSYEFDLGGKLLRIKDSFNNYIEFIYKNNLLIGIKDATNRSLRFYYKPNSSVIEKIEDPIGRLLTFTYDDELKLTSYTNFQGMITTFVYEQKNLVRIIYPNKKEVYFKYESGTNRIVSQSGPGNRTVYFSFFTDTKNPNHASTKFTDENGNSTKYEYFDDERKMIVFDALGNQKITTLASCCHLPVEVKDELGRVTYYSYDADGNIVSTILPNKYTTIYGYTKKNKIQFIRDTAGEFSYRYNKYGKLVETKDPFGNTYKYVYDHRGDLRIVVNPLGYEKKITYDEYGFVARITDGNGKITQFIHDKVGRLISMTDANENRYTFSYDAHDNVTMLTDPLGNTLNARYDSMGNIILLYLDKEHFIKYSYSDLGKVSGILDPYKNTSEFIYSKKGDLLVFKNTLGDTTTYTYDKLGRVIEIADPYGKKYSYAYDGVGNLITFTNPRGFSWHYRYNSLDDLLQITDPLESMRNFSYDKHGNLKKISMGKSMLMSYNYDALKRITKIQYPSNDSMEYSYYPDGTIQSVKSNHRYVLQYEYDKEKNPRVIRNHLGEKIVLAYDNNYNITSYRNQDNNEYNFFFDKLDRLIRVANPLKKIFEFGYDVLGNITSVIDTMGNSSVYAYDVLYRLTTIVDPENNTENYTYDKLGNRETYTDPMKNKKTFLFDKRNQLIQVNSGTKKLKAFWYDELGNITRAKNDTVDFTQTFDALNRLTVYDDKQVLKKIAYTYDEKGRISKIVLPGGKESVYGYDKLGNINVIMFDTTIGQKIEYLGSSKPSRVSYQNGFSLDRVYGDNGRVKTISLGKKSTPQSYTYEYRYNARDDVSAVQTPFSIFRYGFDVYNQLTSIEEIPSKKRKTIEYDSNGNRSLEKIDNQYVYYKYNNLNQLINAGTSTFKYDKQGNLAERITDKGRYQYFFNNDTMLAKVMKDGKIIAEYFYDPFGRRYRKTLTPQDSTTYLYDGINLVYEDGAHTKSYYTYGQNMADPLMYYTTQKGMGYFIKDDSGSVVGTLGEKGDIKILQHFDPFGKKIKIKEDAFSPFGYNGYHYDEESSLYYLYNRYYDPLTGRFISKDPIGLQGGLNEYSYVHNNPIKFTDPLGLFAIKRPHIPDKGEKSSAGFLSYELLPDSFPHLPEFPKPGIRNGYGVFLGKSPMGNQVFINYDFPIFQGNAQGGGGSEINQIKNFGVLGDIITYSYLNGNSIESNPTYDSLKYFKNSMLDKSIVQKMKMSHIIRYTFRSPFVYASKVGKWLWQKTESPFYHLFPNRDDPYFTTPRIGAIDEIDLPRSRNPIFGTAYNGLNFALSLNVNPQIAQNQLYRETFGEALGLGSTFGNGIKASNGERSNYSSDLTEIGEENIYGGTEVPTQSSETVQDPFVSSGCL